VPVRLDENFRYAIRRIASPYDEDGHLKTKKWYEFDDSGAEHFDAEDAVLDVMACAKLSGVMATLGIKYLNMQKHTSIVSVLMTKTKKL